MIEQATRSPAVSLLQASHWRCLEGVRLVKLGKHHIHIYLSFVLAKEHDRLIERRRIDLLSCFVRRSNQVAEDDEDGV